MQIANQNLQTANQNQFWLAVPANQFFFEVNYPLHISGELFIALLLFHMWWTDTLQTSSQMTMLRYQMTVLQ